MATLKSLHLLFMFTNYFHLTTQANTVSLSFPLTVARLPGKTTYKPNLFPSSKKSRRFDQKNAVVNESFSYSSLLLIVPISFGSPPQPQQMLLDTGSQLSWILCDQQKIPKPKSATFKTARSKSFSRVPCSDTRTCPAQDFILGRACNKMDHTCHFSISYADGAQSEGILVRETSAFSTKATFPKLILGCTSEMDKIGGAQGILGMNLGPLSFISQINVSKFSHCLPANSPKGTFYLGNNPNSRTFQFTSILTFHESDFRRKPNLVPFAYTVGLSAITIGGKKLNISKETFLANGGGSGQTILDSGTQYTHLVDEAYEKVKTNVEKKVKIFKKEEFEMCFRGDPKTIGGKIGGMVFDFGSGVNISIDGERNLVNMGGGVMCFAIINSTPLDMAGNIIGNFHQQNLWVEYDVTKKRVGFGRAGCSKSK